MENGLVVRRLQTGPALHRLADVTLFVRMRRAALAFEADLVHVFKPFGYAGWVGNRLLTQGTAPVLADVDDLESPEGWGRNRSWPLRVLAERQERYFLSRCSGITAASLSLRIRTQHVAERVQEPLYLPNGLDRAPESAAVAGNPPTVLLYTRGNDVS